MNHCAFFIDVYKDDLANFSQFDAETRTSYCATVGQAVADADAQGVRSFEHAVGTAYPGVDNFELSSCGENELAKLNDMFFNQIYLDECGGAPSQAGSSTNWKLVLGLIALVVGIVVVLRLLKKI